MGTSATEATPPRSSPAHARGKSEVLPTGSTFRPEIQGLRALAVTLVVVYHVWLGRVSGGVDVFFVITGFLLTGQLYRAAAAGTLHVGKRWRRTFVRLAPAAFTVLVLTMAAAAAVLPQARWPQTIREIVAAALFVENWQLAADSVDYAARSNTVSVVGHFWSLSIQGQFSLVFPLVVALVALVVHGSPARLHTQLTITLLGIFAVSLTYSVALTITDQPFAYFNALTRVWEFAIGGLLALWIDRVRLSPLLATVAGWLGVAGLICCGIVLDVDRIFPGFVALWPTTCAALVLLAGHTRLPWAADRLLASGPAGRLGDLSYALYLWHWPLLVLVEGGGGLDAVSLPTGALVIGGSLVLAALTHYAVERPMLARRSDRQGLRLCTLGLVAVVGLAGAWHVAAVTVLAPEGTVGDAAHPGALALERGPVRQADLLPSPADVYSDFVRNDGWTCTPIFDAQSDMCTEPFTGTPAKRIVVVGDSHAQQFTGVLLPIAASRHWQVTTMLRGACPFSTTSDIDPSNTGCVPWNEDALEEIEQMRPDAVITIGSNNVRDGLTETTPPGFVEQWRNVTALGIPVVAVRDNPRFAYSIPDCVATHDRGSTQCGTDRASVYAPTPPWAHLPDLPADVRFVDIADAVCDQVRCPAEIGNVLVYLDDNHISAAYATTMAGVLGSKIVAAVG